MTSRLMISIFLALSLTGIGGCNSAVDETTTPASSPATSESKGEPSQSPDKQSGDPNASVDNAAGKTSRDAANGSRYRMNPGQSHFTAKVSVGGLLSAFGHDHTIAIRGFSGDVQLTPATLQPASFRMAINANSLVEIGKEFNEKDRQEVNRAMHEQALETAKYPEIVFQSTNISVNKQSEGQYQAKITGNLTLHGVTHAISFPAQVRLEGNSLRAHGEFTVLHSDYKMKQISAGGGTVKAKDPMKLSFEIVANKV